jgi:uncharacterized membrane protein
LITVIFYYRKNDPACAVVEQELESLINETPFQLVLLDIEADPSLALIFKNAVPVIKIGPYSLDGEISRDRIKVALGAASDRKTHIDQLADLKYEERYRRGRNYSRMDLFTEWLSRHYLTLFNTILFIYVGFAFLPPVLLEMGLSLPAKVIYTAYSPFCHQMAFRSWFLFGEQAYYPRNLAGISGVISYETAFLNNQNIPETSPNFISEARAFIGNPQVGYKVALCERDVALYGGMFLFGLVYSLTGRKIRQIPWYVWLLLGLIPIGIDGSSQFPSLIPGLPDWLPIRESTPFLRTLTGALFGGLTAWYLYPLIEESMKETRAFLAAKKVIISQTNQP